MTKSQRILFTEQELHHLQTIIAYTKEPFRKSTHVNRMEWTNNEIQHLAVEYKINRAIRLLNK